MKKIFTFSIALIFLLSACGANPDEPVTSDPSNPSEPIQSEYSPQPEDSALLRGEAYIDSNELLILESFPLQFMLSLKGNLPTPCAQLRVLINKPDAENKIFVEVYSVTNPDQICAQVLSPFDVNVSLGSFPAGKYILFVNGNQVAAFDA